MENSTGYTTGMSNGLADEEKDFVKPLMIFGAVIVAILLLAGLFMPSANYIF